MHQKLTKYLSKSADFVEKMPSQFSFEILGNEIRDCSLCKVRGNFVQGNFAFWDASPWKYQRSKSPSGAILHAVVQDTNWVSAENETQNMPVQNSS